MQSPFSNVSIDLTVPEDLKYRKAIIGGEEADFTYGECQSEIDMFILSLLKISSHLLMNPTPPTSVTSLILISSSLMYVVCAVDYVLI